MQNVAPVFGSRPAPRTRTPLVLASFGAIALALLAAGCSGDANDTSGTSSEELVGGGWRLPSDVAQAGSQVDIRYESPGAWNGGRNCSGKFREGARALGRELMTRFGQISSIGGYSCRRNTANAANVSVHGTGKALDIFIPQHGGGANSQLGDPVANWLVTNAAEIGVQYIIWNRTQWRANGSNTSRYGGPVPHIDHIHAEITEKAAKLQMPFFNQMQQEGPAADQPLATGEPAADPASGDVPVFNAGGTTPPATPTPSPAPATAAPPSNPNAAPDVEDSEPGEADSLGTGIRSVNESSAEGESKPLVGGCSAAPLHESRESTFGSLALVCAAALVVRRRRSVSR